MDGPGLQSGLEAGTVVAQGSKGSEEELRYRNSQACLTVRCPSERMCIPCSREKKVIVPRPGQRSPKAQASFRGPRDTVRPRKVLGPQAVERSRLARRLGGVRKRTVEMTPALQPRSSRTSRPRGAQLESHNFRSKATTRDPSTWPSTERHPGLMQQLTLREV